MFNAFALLKYSKKKNTSIMCQSLRSGKWRCLTASPREAKYLDAAAPKMGGIWGGGGGGGGKGGAQPRSCHHLE